MRSYICFLRSIGEKNSREYCGSPGGGTGGDACVGGSGDAFVIFGLRKKHKGLDDFFMLLPLNPHGLLRESPRKLTTADLNGCYRCYR